jgi:hypothetical protein
MIGRRIVRIVRIVVFISAPPPGGSSALSAVLLGRVLAQGRVGTREGQVRGAARGEPLGPPGCVRVLLEIRARVGWCLALRCLRCRRGGGEVRGCEGRRGHGRILRVAVGGRGAGPRLLWSLRVLVPRGLIRGGLPRARPCPHVPQCGRRCDDLAGSEASIPGGRGGDRGRGAVRSPAGTGAVPCFVFAISIPYPIPMAVAVAGVCMPGGSGGGVGGSWGGDGGPPPRQGGGGGSGLSRFIGGGGIRIEMRFSSGSRLRTKDRS